MDSVRFFQNLWFILSLILFCPVAFSDEPLSKPVIAVIAHPELPVQNLNFTELRKIFLGDRLFWSDDLTVTLLIPPQKSPERQAMLEKIYEKTETQYRHYWIAKVFRAEAATPPKAIASPAMLAQLIRTIPGAISIVNSSQIPQGVKVLKLNGKGPGDPNYPFY